MDMAIILKPNGVPLVIKVSLHKSGWMILLVFYPFNMFIIVSFSNINTIQRKEIGQL